MLNIKEFNNSIAEFDKRTERTDFFKLAKNLLNKGFEKEAFLLLLATWNFAGFRFAVKDFDINKFESTLDELEPYFLKLERLNINTINFEKYAENIKKIYETLSKIKGIAHTGASKLMHLKNPQLFIMWDAYIRGNKPKEIYNYLNGTKVVFKFKRYSTSSDGYYEFLKDMQNKFKNIKLKGKKSLAKAIDEYNYMNITVPLQILEKKKKTSSK